METAVEESVEGRRGVTGSANFFLAGYDGALRAPFHLHDLGCSRIRPRVTVTSLTDRPAGQRIGGHRGDDVRVFGSDSQIKPAMLPVVAAQGMWMRSTVRMAPPAAGPTRGAVGTLSRPPLSVAVVGESTAAGCGVGSHDEGFAGCLARAITARTLRPVQWEVVGQFGATARRIRYRLLPRVGEDFHVAVLLAGGNDVMARRSTEEWRDDLSAIVDGLVARADHVVVAGIPPFAMFPSMPTSLGRYLGDRAAALDEVSRRICAGRPTTTWITMPGVPPPGFFATDRFHPSASGYRVWAKAIADRLAL